MTAPVRRRPGRPRKNPLPEDAIETTSTEEVVIPEIPKKDRPTDPHDPRVGLDCHPDATHLGFEDGSVYEAKDGYLVRRAY